MWFFFTFYQGFNTEIKLSNSCYFCHIHARVDFHRITAVAFAVASLESSRASMWAPCSGSRPATTGPGLTSSWLRLDVNQCRQLFSARSPPQYHWDKLGLDQSGDGRHNVLRSEKSTDSHRKVSYHAIMSHEGPFFLEAVQWQERSRQNIREYGTH